MTITLCNSHPFTFYLPFHTSLRADQCPIHVPTTCTLGLDPCARHSLFGRTVLTTSTTSTLPAAFSALPQHLPSPFSVIVLSSQYLFQRGPIWVALSCNKASTLLQGLIWLCHIHCVNILTHNDIQQFLKIAVLQDQ